MLLNPIRVSVPFQTVAFALLVGALAVTPLAPVYAQKTKPASNLPVNLTFDVGGGELVTSDGDGTYYNGQDGVSATINASSGDLVVTFSTSRHINVVLGMPLSGEGPTPGTYAARRLYVNDIKGVQDGPPQLRIARILDFPSLANHVVGFLSSHQSGTPVGGTSVCVTRVSDTQWTITTETVGCAPGGVGGLFTQANGRKGTIVIAPLATYALPFSATVQLQ